MEYGGCCVVVVWNVDVGARRVVVWNVDGGGRRVVVVCNVDAGARRLMVVVWSVDGGGRRVVLVWNVDGGGRRVVVVWNVDDGGRRWNNPFKNSSFNVSQLNRLRGVWSACGHVISYDSHTLVVLHAKQIFEYTNHSAARAIGRSLYWNSYKTVFPFLNRGGYYRCSRG